MSYFLQAYKETDVFEGFYSNDPDDKGGETYKGIARKMWPAWKGWQIVDKFKSLPGFPNNLKQNDELELLRLEFYKVNFWDKIRGSEIKVYEIAKMLYDDAVNTHPVTAIRKLQSAVFDLSDDKDERDFQITNLGITYGKLDDKTLSKLNEAS